MGFKSAEFVALVLFTAGIITYCLFEPIGVWVLVVELFLWITIQFFCHWYYTIFGATPKKLKGYNECFNGTVRLFPVSETHLIPDLYHIVLHILITADLIIAIFAAVNR